MAYEATKSNDVSLLKGKPRDKGEGVTERITPLGSEKIRRSGSEDPHWYYERQPRLEQAYKRWLADRA